MKDFDSLADENWRILVDEYELNEPTIYYPDSDRPGFIVGPIASVHVGATVDDDEGDEALDLEGEDGAILAAVACLPQIANLFRWIDAEYYKLGGIENGEYDSFVHGLKVRIDWIRDCINKRPKVLNVGQHGFTSFPASKDAK